MFEMYLLKSKLVFPSLTCFFLLGCVDGLGALPWCAGKVSFHRSFFYILHFVSSMM